MRFISKFLLCFLIVCLWSPFEFTRAQNLGQREGNVYAEAKVDAENDAGLYVSDFQWMACGFVGSFIGVGAAYLTKSKPPQERLIGRPVGYITVYTMVYNRATRSIRLKNALIGCLISSTLASCIGTSLLIYKCAEEDPCNPLITF